MTDIVANSGVTDPGYQSAAQVERLRPILCNQDPSDPADKGVGPPALMQVSLGSTAYPVGVLLSNLY